MIEAVDLTDRIGSEVRSGANAILTPEGAAQLRALLTERGVLVFKELGLTDEQQVELAGLMGTVRAEGENGIHKITLDTKISSQRLIRISHHIFN